MTAYQSGPMQMGMQSPDYYHGQGQQMGMGGGMLNSGMHVVL